MARGHRGGLHGDGAVAVCGRRGKRGAKDRQGLSVAVRAVVALGVASLLSACARPLAQQPQPVFGSAPDVAIVTWNLHGDAGELGTLVEDLRAGRLTRSAAPREIVLLLQEASIKNRVDGLQWFFAAARQVRGIERGNAIVSSLPLSDPRAIELPRERQRRVAAMATVRIGAEDLTLVNVHLENRASWWKGGLPGDRARARQARALLARLPPGPAILGGDLNIWLGTKEEAYKAIAATFPDGAGGPPILTFRERLALDHLFYRLPSGWKGLRQRAAHRYGSDHFPVIGVLATN